jgi:hypothetical protein
MTIVGQSVSKELYRVTMTNVADGSIDYHFHVYWTCVGDGRGEQSAFWKGSLDERADRAGMINCGSPNGFRVSGVRAGP